VSLETRDYAEAVERAREILKRPALAFVLRIENAPIGQHLLCDDTAR